MISQLTFSYGPLGKKSGIIATRDGKSTIIIKIKAINGLATFTNSYSRAAIEKIAVQAIIDRLIELSEIDDQADKPSLELT